MKRAFSAKYAPRALALLALFTLICTLLRTLSLALSFDAEIGYFSASPLTLACNLLTLLAVALCLLLFLFINKGEWQPLAAPSLFSLISAGACTLLCVLTAGYLLLYGNRLPAPALLSILALISLLAGAGYFATKLFTVSPAIRVLLGYALLLGLMLVMVITYFDRYTQMNAPHKVSQHLCVLAALAALLAELRVLLCRTPAQKALPWIALAAFACLSVGVSNVAAFALGSYDNVTYLVFDLLLLAIGTHFAAGCASLRPCKEVDA